MKLSTLCNFQMYGRVEDVCGEKGSKETEIQIVYQQTLNSIRSASYADNSDKTLTNCREVDRMRNNQKLLCENAVKFCQTGRNPGANDVFYAPIKTKSGKVVEVACGSFPESVCDKVGTSNLESRLPLITSIEKSQCAQVGRIGDSAGVGRGEGREPGNDSSIELEPKPKQLPENPTADDIVCALKPDAEGCGLPSTEWKPE